MCKNDCGVIDIAESSSSEYFLFFSYEESFRKFLTLFCHDSYLVASINLEKMFAY